MSEENNSWIPDLWHQPDLKPPRSSGSKRGYRIQISHSQRKAAPAAPGALGGGGGGPGPGRARPLARR